MKKLLIVCIFSFLLINCNKDDENSKLPSCVKNFIDETLSNPAGSPRAKVYKYLYQTKIVFVLQYDHSDPISVVYSEDCEVLCDFGGITQENNCEDWQNAEFIENIWVDVR